MGTRKRFSVTATASRLVVVALILFGVVPSPSAQAADLFGHDVSWPQCPAPDGYGLPMPPESTQFVIIGLTKGRAFTENPCLASQVQWVTSRSKPAHAYGMATYPTAAQLTQYGASGPWRTTTLAGRLSNVGYAEAKYAVASLQRIGWRPPVVWIDVEPRPKQPWPAGTDAKRALNRFVVEGYFRGLADSGYSYGLYSYTNGWNEIVGNWKLRNVAVWATAGRLDYPTEALDRCTQASFSGGQVLISQWYDDTRDYNRTCGTYQFTPFPRPPAPMSSWQNEFTWDWNNDLITRTTDGRLWLHTGDGRGRWTAQRQIGSGWNVMNHIAVLGDVTGDGKTEVIAREPSTGYLWRYSNLGGAWSRTVITSGWNTIGPLATVGDFNGDGTMDIIAIQKATGDLYLYKGDTFSGSTRQKIGTGWNVMDLLVGPGDFNGDGHRDLLARQQSSGYLWLYPGTGQGSFNLRVRLTSGWNTLAAVTSAGEVTGDRYPDLIAKEKSSGYLYVYPGDGAGGLQPRIRVPKASGSWSWADTTVLS